MKKRSVILLVVNIFIASFCISQSVTNYQFSAFSGTYSSLAGATTMPFSGGNSDDGWFNAIPLGFTFYYMGQAYTTVSASTKGWMTFGQDIANAAYINQLASGGTRPLVAPLWDDHNIQSNTNFCYLTSGSAPNRVFTAQWSNVKWRYSATEGGISFQVKLYETTGVIEFIYHPEAGALNAPTASIGITAAGANAGNFLSLSNSSSSPSVNSVTETTNISSKPADGQVYAFSPAGPSPAAPTLMTFTAITKTGLTINWNDNSTSETYFNVYYSMNDVDYSLLASVPSSTIASSGNNYSISHSALLPGVTYYYRVTACNEGTLPSAILSGNQATLSPTAIVSVNSGGWKSAATWSTGTVPTALDNVTIANGHTVVIDSLAECNALTVGQGVSGILRFGTTAQTLNVIQGVVVSTGAVFDAGAAGGGNISHTFRIGGTTALASGTGSLTVNGTFDMYIGSGNGKASITFYGDKNAAVSGSGAIDFYRVTLNKGNTLASSTSIPPSLEILTTWTGSGVATTGFMYAHTAGTLKIGGTFTFENKLYTSASYTVSDLGAVWFSNPNFTLTGQSGNPTIEGLFRVASGTVNIGSSNNNGPSMQTGSTMLIEGGQLNFSGRFHATNVISWIQHGGTVNSTTTGNTGANLAGFGLTNAGSSFTMSDGVICLVKPNTNTTPSSRLDYYNNAGILDISGGMVQLGNAAAGSTRTYIMKGLTPNLLMSNTGGSTSATLTGNLTVYGNFDINGSGIFSNSTWSVYLAGMNVSYPGNLTIYPGSTLTMNLGSSARLAFTGSYGNQALVSNGTITSNELSGLSVANTSATTGTITMPTGLTIAGNGTLELASGILSAGSLTLGTGGTTGFNYIRGDGSFSGTLIRNFGTGTVNYTYNGTTAQSTGSELPGSISGTLTISNPSGVSLGTPLESSKFTLTQGTLGTTATNTLTITGTSVSDLTWVSGQVSGPLTRRLPSSLAAGTVYLFPLGKSAYRPLELVDPLTGSGGTTSITAEVFDENAGGTAGATMISLATNRYWSVSFPAGTVNFVSSMIRLTETDLTTNSGIASSSSKTGIYELASIFEPSGNTLVTSPVYGPGFFVTGDKRMNFVSAEAFQASTTYVREGAANQEILGIRIVTSGNLDPALLTSFTFNTNGTTRTADLAAAKVYFTGNSATFATSQPFGNMVINPSGQFTVTGSQALTAGTNYLWLTYDVAIGVIDNDLIDAVLESVVVRGNPYTPLVSDPSGNRIVRAALSGTVTIGSGGDFATLTGAGGLFEKVALVGLKSNLTASIISNISEAGTNQLTGWYEAGAGSYRLTISPATPSLKTISGSYAGGLIRLNKVQRVTFDGRYAGAGRHLLFSNTSVSGTIAAIQLIGTQAGQGCTNVTISNCRITSGHNGNGSYGICAGGANPGNAGYDHDSLQIIGCSIAKAANGVYISGFSAGTHDNILISNDSIGSTIAGEEIRDCGIFALYCPGIIISGNEVFNLRSTVSEPKGINLGVGGFNSVLSGNRVSSVKYTGTGTIGATGIFISPGFTTANILVYNNIVTDVSGIGSNNLAAASIAGIKISNGSGISLFYNSVSLSGTFSHATSGDVTTAIYLGTQGDITLKNNIFRNSLVNLSASAYAYAIYSDMERTGFTLIDYNDYHGAGTQARLGYCAYSTATTIASWRVITLQDAHSTGDDPLFTSDTDLHLDLTSSAYKTGIPVAGITVDFEEVARDAATPSMGALETARDSRGPFIQFTSLANTAQTTSRTLVTSITDSAGVPVSGSGLPVLYWNINRGPWNSITAAWNGGSAYAFTFGGGVTMGDSVFYYIAAQDMMTPVNVSVSPAAGASGFSPDPPSCSTPPSNPAYYKILQGLSGTVTVGTGGDYPNLTGSGGLFETINNNILSGNVLATVISDLVEPATFSIRAWQEEGAGNYYLTIAPDGTTERVISGNPATALITLQGAKRVVINGGNNDTTSRYLRFRNNSASQPAIRFLNGATYNTIRNCHIESIYIPVQFSTSNVITGNSYNTIAWNDIHPPAAAAVNPTYGIYSLGTTSYPNRSNTLKGNNISNFVNAGIYITSTGNGGDWMIDGNSIFSDPAVTPVTLQRGIYFNAGWLSFGNTIRNNYIGGSSPQCGGDSWENSGTEDFWGIHFNAGSAANYILSNTIANIDQSNTSAGYFYGILVTDCWCMISGNTIGSENPVTSIRNASLYSVVYGIRIEQPTSRCDISLNTLTNFVSTSTDGYPEFNGIWVENADVLGNRIRGIGQCIDSGTSPLINGIFLNTSIGSINQIINNSVILDGGASEDPEIYGVYEYGSSEDAYLFLHNSVSITAPGITDISSQQKPASPGIFYYNQSAALYRYSSAWFEMYNNSLANFRSLIPGSISYCFDISDTIRMQSDYNNLFSGDHVLGLLSGTAMNTLNDWRYRTGRDLHSGSTNPLYLNPGNDLHPATGSPLPSIGLYSDIAPEDLDGLMRDTISPTAGCYEFSFVPDKTWIGSSSEDWSNPANWSPAGVPTASDQVLVNLGTPYACKVTLSGMTCLHMVVAPQASLTINSGGSLTILGMMKINPGGNVTNHGILTMKGHLLNQN